MLRSADLLSRGQICRHPVREQVIERGERTSLARPGRALGSRASGLARSHEGSPAVHRDDDASVAQHRHGVPHGGVGDLVLFGETPLARELQLDLALGDPSLNIVRNLKIGVFSPKGINRTSRHMINLGCSVSFKKTS